MPAARAATAAAIRASVSSGRCGPCCSADPTGHEQRRPAVDLRPGPLAEGRHDQPCAHDQRLGDTGPVSESSCPRSVDHAPAAGTANPASGLSSHARSGLPAGGRTESVSGTGAFGLREFRGAEREWSTSDFGIGVVGRAGRQGLLAEPAHALRVGPVQRQPGEELRRHAPALARVEERARRARARRSAAGADPRTAPSPATPPRTRPASGRCRPGSSRGSRTGTRRRRRPGRSGTPPAPPRTGSAPAAPGRRPRGGRTSRRSAPPRRGRPASRRAGAAAPRSGCSSSHTSAPRPDGRSRVIRSCAPNLSAIALNSSSWSTFCRVITTEILGWPNPASARFSNARIAVSYEPGPRTKSLTCGGRPVERDLDVDVVGRGQLRRPLLVELDPVGGELDPHVVADRVVEQLPEVRAHRRLAAADVDVEDLHPLQLVDHRLAPRRW